MSQRVERAVPLHSHASPPSIVATCRTGDESGVATPIAPSQMTIRRATTRRFLDSFAILIYDRLSNLSGLITTRRVSWRARTPEFYDPRAARGGRVSVQDEEKDVLGEWDGWQTVRRKKEGTAKQMSAPRLPRGSRTGSGRVKEHSVAIASPSVRA